MRLIKWIVFNGIFAGVIYAAYIMKIDGAENVALFFAWLNIVISWTIMTDPAIKILSEKGRSVPQSVNTLYDFSVAAAFVWFGAWITAIFWVLHWILQEGAWQKVDELKGESQ